MNGIIISTDKIQNTNRRALFMISLKRRVRFPHFGLYSHDAFKRLGAFFICFTVRRLKSTVT